MSVSEIIHLERNEALGALPTAYLQENYKFMKTVDGVSSKKAGTPESDNRPGINIKARLPKELSFLVRWHKKPERYL